MEQLKKCITIEMRLCDVVSVRTSWFRSISAETVGMVHKCLHNTASGDDDDDGVENYGNNHNKRKSEKK